MKQLIEEEELKEFSVRVHRYFRGRFRMVRAVGRFLWAPFRGKLFWYSLFLIFFIGQATFSFFVLNDYVKTQYGSYEKMLCLASVDKTLRDSVVRIVGGESEGSGFFIANNQVLTNFHVIDGEPSPKIIFPNGRFITPVKISGNKDLDLAILHTEGFYSNKRLNMLERFDLGSNETLVSAGYPLGTGLVGGPTVIRGKFLDYRKIGGDENQYIQANINLVDGMSGGPLTDLCGNVIGINTLGMSGQSLFVPADLAWKNIPNFNDQEIEKIDYKPEVSPAEAVKAYYNYLKARKMDEAYGLLTADYKKNAEFREWSNRFYDILDVEVVSVKKDAKDADSAYIKFVTKNWQAGTAIYHYYQGSWKTKKENDVYKLTKSNIEEIEDPDFDWYWDEDETY